MKKTRTAKLICGTLFLVSSAALAEPGFVPRVSAREFNVNDLYHQSQTLDPSEESARDTELNDISQKINELPPTSNPLKFLNFDISFMKPDGLSNDESAPRENNANALTAKVQIFPCLNYLTKDFCYAEKDSQGPRPSDPYAVTKNLKSVKFVAVEGTLHLKKLNGQILGDGKELWINLKKDQFVLDGKEYPFEGLSLDQTNDEITCVEWESTLQGFDKTLAAERKFLGVKNPCFGPKGRSQKEVAKNIVGLPYRGSFEITPATTPRGLSTVEVSNELDFMHYVADVLPVEMNPAEYPELAVHALAFLLETYGLNYMKTNGKLCPGAACQVYTGVVRESPQSLAAAQKVFGKCLMYKGQCIKAMYSSNSGGETKFCKDYSSARKCPPYLVAVNEIDPTAVRHLSGGTHLHTFDLSFFLTVVQSVGGTFHDSRVIDVEPAELNASGRAIALRIRWPSTQAILNASQFSALRGKLNKYSHARIPMNDYIGRAIIDGSKIIIPSYGYGHGFGASQEGLVAMAQEAAEKAKVLGKKISPEISFKFAKMYFPGTTVGTVNELSSPLNSQEIFKENQNQDQDL